MKILIALFVVAFLACSGAFAEGGKNRNANPVLVDEDTECVWFVPNINTKDCQLVGTAVSGQDVFTCDEVITVFCTE